MTAVRPTVGRPAPFELPERTTVVLDNGLEVTLVGTGSIPKVDVRLMLGAGGLYEEPGRTWLSELVAQFLKEGTAHRSANELAEAVAGCGGQLHVDAGDDTATVRAQVLSEFGPEFMGLLGEVVREPLLPDSELPRLTADLRRSLDLARAQPNVVTMERFRAALYGDHPYGRVLPTVDSIDALSMDHVRSFVEQHVGAARARLYVAGRFDAAAVMAAVHEAFDRWPPGPAPLPAPPEPRSERAIHLIDRPGAEQSTVYLGLPVLDPSQPDYVPLVVTDALLGGAFMSRITTNIREEKGYTYSPRSSISVRYRDAYWVQVADVTTDVTGASLHEIFAEIDRLRAEPPSAEELDGVQNYVAGSFLLRNSTPGGVLDQLDFVDFHQLGEGYASGFIDRVYALTPEDVQRMAVTHLRPDEMTIAIAGAAEEIAGQIEPYGRVVE